MKPQQNASAASLRPRLSSKWHAGAKFEGGCLREFEPRLMWLRAGIWSGNYLLAGPDTGVAEPGAFLGRGAAARLRQKPKAGPVHVQ